MPTLEDAIGAFNSLSDAGKTAFMKKLWEAMPPTATHLLMIFKAAPDKDKLAFADRILHKYLLPLLPAERLHAAMERVIGPQVEAIRKRDKEARDPKARFEERDDEIERLRDEVLPGGKQRSFGQVRQLVEDRWPTMENGEPLTAPAVGGAYKRRKKKRRDARN